VTVVTLGHLLPIEAPKQQDGLVAQTLDSDLRELILVGADRFDADRIRGRTMEDLLLDEGW